jgi:GxxExxY protein
MKATQSSGPVLPFIEIRAAGFSSRFIMSAWRSNWNFNEFHFGRNHRRRCIYRGRTLVQTFHPDFVCYEKIILEIKAVSQLCDEHRAQVLNYLSATSCKLGRLVNFGHYPRLEYERLLLEARKLLISGSENFASFRVFGGL